MKITSEMSLKNFKAWRGAKDTLNKLIELDKCDDLEFILESEYPNGLTDAQLNDLLWFDQDWIYETLGIEEE